MGSFFIIFSLGNSEQLRELIVETENIPENLKNNVSIDLKLEVGTEKEKKEIHSLNVSLNAWKTRILEKYNNQKITFVTEHSEADGTKTEKFINVVLDDHKSPDIMTDKTTNSVIKTKTFMKFQVVPCSKSSLDPADIPGNYEILKNSFKHELTSIGQMTLGRLKKNLSISHLMWMANYENYAAPMVTFCQSSGSGKSKLSIEFLKLNPGFYLVFRETNQTGYPRMNTISEKLMEIIRDYNDLSSSQENLEYSKCTVGKILDFFTRILVSYVRNLCAIVEKRESLGLMSLKENLDYSIREIGSLFLENETMPEKYLMISREEMEKLYTRFGGNLSVKTVTNLFYNVLKFPEQCLNNIDSQSQKDFCILLSNRFEKYPFLFVLDEADILSNIKKITIDWGKEVSGLEILKRALGYINSGTASLFLTLGTRSDVVDLNPSVIDISARLMNRKKKLNPITLTSNSNIFSKDFPIHELSPTYALLRNPFMFKFISTLGHGLWSAYPFSQILGTALMKLKNGSAGTKGYFLPVWMIRTGLAANPLHVKANFLVAGHMATLHNVEDNLNNFLVSYPSEPILALASRVAMSENQDLPLFDILKNNTEALSLDIGRFAEVFGAMIILRAIDRTPNFARICHGHDYDQVLGEIKSLTPSKFHSIWENETQLLGVPQHEKNFIRDTRYLKNYTVNNVGDFLRTLIKTDDLDKLGIPKSILNGIINATHFVTIMRDNSGFKVGELSIEPSDLPSADKRISNNSRNIIDTALLKIGLLKQCGFAMPTNYYGLDFILPVCLENDDLTFIGIQIKRSDANMSEDVHKMRSRLHLVSCQNDNCINSKCSDQHCLSSETLQNIHGNHLSLLLSLDDDDITKVTKFTDDVKFRSGITNPKDCKILLKAMTENEVPTKLSGLSDTASSDSFLKPLVQKTIMLRNDVGMGVSLWNDKLVNLPEKSNEVVRSHFNPDPWVHRQYTLMTRGWKCFKHLFSESEKAFKIANDMISNDGLFRNVNQRSDPQLVRCVVYDVSPSYVQYSDELSAMRGKGGSNLEALDDVEMKLSKNLIEPSKLAEKIDKKLVISPPDSPKKMKNQTKNKTN